MSMFIFLVSLITMVAGVFLGFVLYSGKDKEPLPIPFIRNKFYLDEIYIGLVRVFQDGVGLIAKGLDSLLIDGAGVKGAQNTALGLGNVFRRVQMGNLQGYAFLFGLGVLVVTYLLVFASS